MAVRKIHDRATKMAAHMLEVAEEDLSWDPGQSSVKYAPGGKSETIQDGAFGVAIDRGTGEVSVWGSMAVDDCANIISCRRR